MTFEDWKKQFEASYKGKKAIASLNELAPDADQLAELTHKVLYACYQAETYSQTEDFSRRAREYAKDVDNDRKVIERVQSLTANHPTGAPALQASLEELAAFEPGMLAERMQGPLRLPTKQTQSHQPDAQLNGLLFHLARTFRMRTSNTEDTFLFPKQMPTDGKPCHKQISLFVTATLGVDMDVKSRLKDLMKKNPKYMGWTITRDPN